MPICYRLRLSGIRWGHKDLGRGEKTKYPSKGPKKQRKKKAHKKNKEREQEKKIPNNSGLSEGIHKCHYVTDCDYQVFDGAIRTWAGGKKTKSPSLPQYFPLPYPTVLDYSHSPILPPPSSLTPLSLLKKNFDLFQTIATHNSRNCERCDPYSFKNVEKM